MFVENGQCGTFLTDSDVLK